jgi:glycosyltransferase involved in cell wall biosynthesis
MRIAVYLPQLSASAAGGFTFQDDLINALRDVATQHRHSFVLVSRTPPAGWESFDRAKFSFVRGPGDRRVAARRVFSALWPGADLMLRGMGFATALDARLRRHAVDLVWFATPYCCDTDLPNVFTIWDLQHRVQPWFPEVSRRGRWDYREHWYSRAVQRSSLVITPNSAGRREVETFYGVLPDRVLELAHSTPNFALAASGQAAGSAVAPKFGLRQPFLFYPAQFWPHKNHVVLLRALALLKQAGLEPQLALVGPDRGNLAYVRECAREFNVESQVKFLGFVDRTELIALYREAVAMVYPSYFGPENLPPLEAFAFGCPVIAARVSGAEQQIGDAARLVDPADAAAYAGAIGEVMKDPELRADMIRRGHKRARQWTAVDYVNRLLHELERLGAARESWPRATSGARRP